MISVIGCGYLGAVHAAAMASLGHRVIGIDTNTERVATLQSATAPFFEPGLDELLQEGVASDQLSFSSDIANVSDASVHFICVGTPQTASGSTADLTFVNSAVDALLPHLSEGDLVVGKST